MIKSSISSSSSYAVSQPWGIPIVDKPKFGIRNKKTNITLYDNDEVKDDESSPTKMVSRRQLLRKATTASTKDRTRHRNDDTNFQNGIVSHVIEGLNVELSHGWRF